MEAVSLNGTGLTIRQVQDVARSGARVELSPEAMGRLRAARQFALELVGTDKPIYGFNVGVGWNKDRAVDKDFFTQYNTNLIRSHCIGVPPDADEASVRAVMLARLNTMLWGGSGASPALAEMLADLLNHGIHPVVPSRGSVGQADLGLLAHIGLAMIGEGTVRYGGQTMPAAQAFGSAGLRPLELGPKDGLAVVCSNAYSAGTAALLLWELEELLAASELIYALSLEGLGGNPATLDPRSHALRRFTGQRDVAARVSRYLAGSGLYGAEEAPVHDPLCFRNFPQVHGAVLELLDYTRERLELQLNTPDDNPLVLPEERAVLPTANYDPINWVLGLESLAIGLSHVSKAACQRIIRLDNPAFTGLPRFLSPGESVLGFATTQKAFTALDAEIRHLCNPVSMDTLGIAGDMEDLSTNAPYLVQNLGRIAGNLRYIFAIELIHGAQAVDLRAPWQAGAATGKLLEVFRRSVPFYDRDQNITRLIGQAHALLSQDTFRQLLQ